MRRCRLIIVNNTGLHVFTDRVCRPIITCGVANFELFKNRSIVLYENLIRIIGYLKICPCLIIIVIYCMHVHNYGKLIQK